MPEEKKSGLIESGKWLIGVIMTIIAGYFAHQADVGQKNANRFQKMGDILSDLTGKTARQAEQIKAHEKDIQRLEEELKRHQDHGEERFRRHEDRQHD